MVVKGGTTNGCQPFTFTPFTSLHYWCILLPHMLLCFDELLTQTGPHVLAFGHIVIVFAIVIVIVIVIAGGIVKRCNQLQIFLQWPLEALKALHRSLNICAEF